MKLKGVGALNRAVNRLTKRRFKIKAKLDTQFYALLGRRAIAYTVVTTEVEDEYFREYIFELYPDAPDLDIITWSILHEVGHIRTENWVTDWHKYDLEVEQYTREESDCREIRIFKMRKYFRTECESLATQWACDFVRRNQEYIKKMDAKICKALAKFYEKNSVEV